MNLVSARASFFICTRGCGCIEHPAFPAPSFFRRRENFLLFGVIRNVIRHPEVAVQSTALEGRRPQSGPFILRGSQELAPQDDGAGITDSNFKQLHVAHPRDLATLCVRVLLEFLAPSKERGRRECRVLDAPAASRAIKKKRTRTYKVHRNHTGIPCAMVLTAPPWSPWCTGLVSHPRLWKLRSIN